MSAEHDPARRRFPRIAAQHSVLLKKIGEGEELEEFARTKTLAAGGCSVASRERVGVGSNLELLIAADGDVLKVKGRVVYENELADGSSDIGVAFADLTPQDAERITQLLEKPREAE